MNLGYLTVGLLFLFNPNLNIIDFFPDFIGYLFIYYALEKSSDLIERLGDARKLFWKLSIVTLVKTACIILIPFVEDELTLVLTFSSAVVELLYLIPAMVALFEGLVYAGSRFSGTAVFKKADSLKYFTVMFLILKSVCSVLPELTSLSIFDSLGDVRATTLDIRKFKPAFIVICGSIVLIFGIIWLIRIVIYTRRIAKDTVMIRNLEEKYTTEILPKKEMFVCRNMKKVSNLVIAGVILSICFYVDSINVIPNILGSVFFIFAFIHLIKYNKKSSWTGIILSCVSGILYLINFVLQIKFTDEYGAEAMKWLIEAERLYYLIEAVSVIQYALFIVMCMILINMYIKLVNIHVKLLSPAHGETHRESMNNNTVREITGKLNVLSVFVVVCGAVYALNPVIVLFFSEIWMVSAVLSIVLVIVTIWALNSLNENIYGKYLYYN